MRNWLWIFLFLVAKPVYSADSPKPEPTPAPTQKAAAAPAAPTWTYLAAPPSNGAVILVQTTPMAHRNPLTIIGENLSKAHWDVMVLSPKESQPTVTSDDWKSTQDLLSKLSDEQRKILVVYGAIDAKLQTDLQTRSKNIDGLVFLSLQTNTESTPTVDKWWDEYKKPILEITAYFDYQDVIRSAESRGKKWKVNPLYRHRVMEGAYHDYSAQTDLVAKTIQGWAQTVKKAS